MKFLLQIVINIYGAGQERSTTVSVYGHLENTEPLSWCEAAFQPVVLKILLKLIKLRTQKVQRDFESPRNTFWKASEWQRLLWHDRDPKHTADAGPVTSEFGMYEAFLMRDVKSLFKTSEMHL